MEFKKGEDPSYPPSVVYTPAAGDNNPSCLPPPYIEATAGSYPIAVMPQANPVMSQANAMATTTYEWGQFPTSGLDILNDIDCVRISKVFSAEQALTYTDQARKFAVLTKDETKQMFSMVEDKDKMVSHTQYRSFEINALDPSGRTVFTIVREDSSFCTVCCFCCACFGDECKFNVKVKIGEQIIGSIKQNCTFSHASYTIYKDGNGDEAKELLHITGGSALCVPTTTFDLRLPNDTNPSGHVLKTGGPTGDHVNHYILNFPKAGDNELKALCMAAVVLMDFRFYNVPTGGGHR